MKGKISKRILAVLCAASVILTSISFPFQTKAEETLDSTMTKVTFKDYGLSDDTYKGTSAEVTKGISGSTLEGKVLSGYVTFSESASYLFVGGGEKGLWTGLVLKSGCATQGNLELRFGGSAHTITPDDAGVKLTGNTFNLKLSYQVLDTNADETKDTLQFGLWFNDKLYKNQYFTVSDYQWTVGGTKYDCTYKNYLTGWVGVHAPGTASLKIESDVPETLDPSLTEISFDAFGWEDGTLTVMSDLQTKFGYKDNLIDKVFSGDVKFSANEARIYIGGGDLGNWGGLRIRSGVGKDSLEIKIGENTYLFTSDIAGTALTDNTLNLKISYQLEDNNMDGANDTLKLGVWFNNVLYNNKYLRLVKDDEFTYIPYLSGGLGIYVPSSEGKLTIGSVKPGAIGQYITESNTGDMNRVPYNNNEITADLSVGVAGFPVVVDMNKDGYMDILIGGNPRSVTNLYKGTYVFYGNAESSKTLVMEKGRQILENGNTFRGTYLYDENGKYEKTMLHMAVDPATGSQTEKYIDASTYPSMTEVLASRRYGSFPETIEGVVSNSYNFMQQTMADYDGDGKLDMITAWDCWSEYSDVGTNTSGVKFNEAGVWDGNDADNEEDVIHGWILWNKNTGESKISNTYAVTGLGELVMVYEDTTDAEGNKTIVEGSAHALDTYGSPNPQFYDWDHDGDLDIVCASFISKITYYENIGSKTEPLYIEGRQMPLGALQPDGTWTAGSGSLEFELAMPQLTCFDWNGDGWMDILCSEEDGRLSISEHTGKLDENGTPIMKDYKYFQTPADSLKSGALSTPVSVDWDGDGDEDIITGNSAGYIDFIQNLSIEKNQPLTDPVWKNPVHLTNPEGKVYRIMAGEDLSCQGPSEAKWGYTQVSVADWNGDGVLDIMSNNIVGQVYIHKGIKGNPYQICDPEKIYVEWESENYYPDWLWWTPEENSLVTLWRTTPFMIDLPLDEDRDGKAKGDGLMDLVIMDSKGYLSFFQRYRAQDGTLKLKEGQQIFKKGDCNTILGFNTTLTMGQSGKINYILTDFDMDGKLDLIRNYELNFFFYKNIATTPGEYIFDATGVRIHPTRNLQDHTPCPAICDWNKDGVPDLLAGTMDGCFYYMTNKIYDPDSVPAVVEPANPEDYLTAYWDFEGTDDEVYADKATAGRKTDTLSVINDSVSIADGVATITGNASLQAAHSTDVNPNKAMTIVFKAKVSGDGSNISLVDKRFSGTNKGNDYRCYSVGIQKTQSNGAYVTALRAEMANSNASLKFTNTPTVAGIQPFANGEWKEYAFVVAPNSSGGLTGTLYASVGEYAATTSDWVTLGTLFATGSAKLLVNEAVPLNIGNDGEYINSKYTREFEEVRIYNAALSLAQISELNLGDPKTPADYLTAYWDFEGNGDEVYADKATAGETADTLSIVNNSVSIADGVATMTGAGALEATHSTDVNPTSEMTILFKAKVSGADVGNISLVDKRFGSDKGRTYSVGIMSAKDSTGAITATALRAEMRNTAGWLCYTDVNAVAAVQPYQKGQWKEYALVVTPNGSGWLIGTLYASVGEFAKTESDWVKLGTMTAKNSDELETYALTPLRIGNDGENRSSSYIREFEEVRIYSKALTLAQIAEMDLGDPDLSADFNTDNKISEEDIIVLKEALLTGMTDEKYDLTGNGIFDIRDIVRMKKIISSL